VFLLSTDFAFAEPQTVLVPYTDKVARFKVSAEGCDADGYFVSTNVLGGATNSYIGIVSNGRRVYLGDELNTGRILEFDMDGNYLRQVVKIGAVPEQLALSPDGVWLYVSVGWASSMTVNRYNTATGAGGVFITKTGSNLVSNVGWTFDRIRGVAVDADRHLWVASRNNNTLYQFNADTGAYITNFVMNSPQGLLYSDINKTLYCTSLAYDHTYLFDIEANTVKDIVVSGSGNRLGLVEVEKNLYWVKYDTQNLYRVDLAASNMTVAVNLPAMYAKQITAIPQRQTRGWLLVSESETNRVTRMICDTAHGLSADGVFAGGDGVTYAGKPLRNPRGLVFYSNLVYVAEGVAGGRVLMFSRWGRFRSEVVDFANSVYPDCVPAALAVTPDGGRLYVTDAHELDTGSTKHGSLTTNDLASAGYGETIYTVDIADGVPHVFVDSSDCGGKTLLEPRGVAVDGAGNVYCSSWYDSTTALEDSGYGCVYLFASLGGTYNKRITLTHPSVCYYDSSTNSYVPAVTNAGAMGPGVIFTGSGIQDLFWTSQGGLSISDKLLDMGGMWRTYLDVETIDGWVFFTEPAEGTIWLRTGGGADDSRASAFEGLVAPAYLTFIPDDGACRPPSGTLLRLQ